MILKSNNNKKLEKDSKCRIQWIARKGGTVGISTGHNQVTSRPHYRSSSTSLTKFNDV